MGHWANDLLYGARKSQSANVCKQKMKGKLKKERGRTGLFDVPGGENSQRRVLRRSLCE